MRRSFWLLPITIVFSALLFSCSPSASDAHSTATRAISATATAFAPRATSLAVRAPTASAPSGLCYPSPSASLPSLKVTRVIDGDTIVVEGNLHLRYIGMNAPGTHGKVEAFGREAAEANQRLVEGKVVALEKDVSETDKYGRLLRYVYVDGVMVNAELVRRGFAQAISYPPDVKYQNCLRRLQREARAAERGLWGKR